MKFSDAILAGVVLNREAIQSDNFVSGSTGWRVLKTGSAEFNNVIIRGGTTVGGDFLAYNGIPANGNLVVSISANGGTDPFGNVYLPGSVSYGTRTGVNYYSAITGAIIELGVNGSSASPAFLEYNSLGGNVYELFMTSGRQSGSFQNANISLVSESVIGAHDQTMYLDANSVQVTNDLEVTGNVTANNMASGTVAFSSAEIAVNGVGTWCNNKAVSFPNTFTSVPVVMVTCTSGGPGPTGTVALSWVVSGVTTSGFNLRCLRGNNGATTFSWLAMGV